MRLLYPPGQLGLALHKTLQKHKKELGVSPAEKKIEWVKKTALEIIDFLDQKVGQFNRDNNENRVTAKDLVTVVSTSLNLIVNVIKAESKK